MYRDVSDLEIVSMQKTTNIVSIDRGYRLNCMRIACRLLCSFVIPAGSKDVKEGRGTFYPFIAILTEMLIDC